MACMPGKKVRGLPILSLGLILALSPALSTAQAAQSAKPFTFETFTIRPHKPGAPLLQREYLPDGYRASWVLDSLITHAYVGPYGVPAERTSQPAQVPDWATGWYDIQARVAPEDMAAWQKAKYARGEDSGLLQEALRAALQECCKLAVTVTTADTPYWNIIADKHGAKLKETVPGAVKSIPGKTDAVGQGFCIHEGQQLHFVGVTIEEFAVTLARMTKEDRPIQNKTALTGRYDFTLPWYDESNYPSSEITDPLERMPLNSIGLKLVPGTGPSFLLTIDHIDKPEPD